MFKNFAERIIHKNVKADEEVITILRSHPIKHFISGLIIFVLVIVPLVFFIPLVRMESLGFSIIITSFVLAGLLFIREMYIWHLHLFIVTTKRIVDIDQSGIFTRVLTEARFDRVQDVSYTKKGLYQTFFNVGNIVIQTAGKSANIELDYVHAPEDVQKIITDQQAKVEETIVKRNAMLSRNAQIRPEETSSSEY